MKISYTCQAVNYDPGEDRKRMLMFIFDFDVEAQALNGFIYTLINAVFYMPMKPIDYVEKNVGKIGQYTCGFPEKAHIQINDANNFKLQFQKNVINGVLTEENLRKLGTTDLRELVKEDVCITSLFTNLQFNRNKSGEGAAIYIASIRKSIF